MSNDLAFIDDGYNKDCLIKAVPGLYPDVRFTFRPATGSESEIIMGQTRREQNDDRNTTFMAQVIAKHVLEWDIKNAKGAQVEITVPNVRKLHPVVFQKVFSSILGLTPSDDASVQSKESQGDSQIMYEALLQGTSQEQVEVKN